MKIYLAGPDVFRPDVDAWAAAARKLCRTQGHEALIPLDGNGTTALGIFHNNVRLIAGADVVVENFRPDVKFRLGIDYDSLKADNPGLVYASI